VVELGVPGDGQERLRVAVVVVIVTALFLPALALLADEVDQRVDELGGQQLLEAYAQGTSARRPALLVFPE
jgi:hypothetical protein